MVYAGRPSAGCENCRKSKKRCDQGLPSCSRCARLGKTCSGYRNVTDLLFRDETSSVARRAGSTSSSAGTPAASSSAALTRQPSPDKDDSARQFFFMHFVTPFHLSFLATVPLNEFLLKPVMACALAAMANGNDDQRGRERARQHYVDAITATNAAIRHPVRVKEDETLIAVCLLSCYERVAWDMLTSDNSWKTHIEGAAQVLWLRGPSQVQTVTGALLFRELRDNIVNNCNLSEQEVPHYIVDWTKLLDFDPVLTPSDLLAILASRCAALRAAFRLGSIPDQNLSVIADTLEQDLVSWATNHSVLGSVCAFESVRDARSPHAWNGVKHIYGSHQAQKHWNKWRCTRILISRIQEALWRRSWPVLASPSRPVPPAEHFQAVRNQVVEDICVAAAHDLGSDSSMQPQNGSVASGLMLTISLTLAGTCLIEQLSNSTVSPGGRRLIHINEPLHLDLFSQASAQLAWIIDRIDYIAEKVGIRWASTVSSFLKGESGVYYEICRSRIVRNEELDAAIFGEFLDLESMSLSMG